MTADILGTSADESTAPQSSENIACPFCGLLCDDLEVGLGITNLEVRRNGCVKARAGFERSAVQANPQLQGNDAELSDAIKYMAELIGKARLPLYGGLATDVEGMRAVMSLADRSGGVVDHALSGAFDRNIKVLHTNGWITSTLTETRNRADLILVAGSDVHRMHPRFFERVVCAPETMFGDEILERTVVLIGESIETSTVMGPGVKEILEFTCPDNRIGEIISALRARLHNFPVQAEEIAGVNLADIDSLAERCLNADYGVVVWAPPSLNYPNADLTVQMITEFVRDMNEAGRFAGLSLGGNEGLTTAGAVCSWQSGYPLHVSYASGAPDYDPVTYSIDRMLENGEGDLLIWIASITPDLAPPSTSVPTVVLGTPDLQLSRQPEVFIPVGTPGIDHAGRLIRCDSVVSLPMRRVRPSALPKVGDVLQAIEAAL